MQAACLGALVALGACSDHDDDDAPSAPPNAGAPGNAGGAIAGSAGTRSSASSGSGAAGATMATGGSSGSGALQRADAGAAGSAAASDAGGAGTPAGSDASTGPAPGVPAAPGTRRWEVLYDGGDYDWPGTLAIDAQGTALINLISTALPTVNASGEQEPNRELIRAYAADGALASEHEGGGVLGFNAAGELVALGIDNELQAKALLFTRRDPSFVQAFARSVAGMSWGAMTNFYGVAGPDGGAFACMSEATNSLHVVSVGPDGALRFDVERVETSGLLARVAPRPDGGVVVATSRPNAMAGDTSTWVFALDAAGEQDWEWTLDLAPTQDIALAVRADAGGNVYVLGALYDERLWLRKLAASGVEQWDVALGGTQSRGGALAIDASGNVIVVWEDELSGRAESWHLSAYLPDGTERFTITEPARRTNAWGRQLEVAPDGDILVLGTKDLGRGGRTDVWLARYAN